MVRTHAGLRGFTLVEMLVSLAIFAVVTAFATANFRAGRESDELRIAANVVATTLRRAQTMTIAGQTTPVCRGGSADKTVCATGAAACPGGTCADEVPAAYGVRFNVNTGANTVMTVFADIDHDLALDAGEAVRVEPFAAGPLMSVTAVTPAVGGILDVVFEPPKPKVWYNASDVDARAAVTITHSATGKQRIVTVNAVSGQIGIE